MTSNQFTPDKKSVNLGIIILLVVLSLYACSSPPQTPSDPISSPLQPVETPTTSLSSESTTLNQDQAATLSSLKRIDDYPLYTMHYYGSYNQTRFSTQRIGRGVRIGFPTWKGNDAWGCSLFASFGDINNIFFGRNFDWEYSPGLLLFTDPPGGYASVSMVDIEYLGFAVDQFISLTELPLEERQPLLDAPFWPFDGMNEVGLAIAMAAVPPGRMVPDSNKMTIGSLEVMREILDTAGNIDQAVNILSNYNIDFRGGPPIHYLIADSSGQAILVEFYQGKMNLIPNESPWHQATNYLVSAVENTQGQCSRYDTISNDMTRVKGELSAQGGLDLLSDVSQINTQWSILYHMSSGEMDVVIGRQFDHPYTFHLNP